MTPLILLNKQDLLEVVREFILPLMQEVQQNSSINATVYNQSELMTRKEAAAYLKITLVTLNAWTRQGTISSKRIEGRVYYYRSALESKLR